MAKKWSKMAKNGQKWPKFDGPENGPKMVKNLRDTDFRHLAINLGKNYWDIKCHLRPNLSPDYYIDGVSGNHANSPVRLIKMVLVELFLDIG